MKTLLADEIMNQEICEFLVTSNNDLVLAENQQLYEQCDLIQTAIHLFLANYSQLLATKKVPASMIFTCLEEQSKFCFDSIKEKYEYS